MITRSSKGRDLATICLAVAVFVIFAGCASEGDPFGRDVRPVVAVGAVSPADGSNNVSPDTNITITFPLDLDIRTVTRDNVHVMDFSQADSLPADERNKRARVVATKLLFDARARTITIVPDTTLAPNARYQVLLQDVRSTTDVFFNTVVTTFTTGSVPQVAPVVLNVDPPNGAALVGLTTPVTLTFSRPMDRATTLRALSVGPGIAGTATFIPGVDRSQLIFTPGGRYPANTRIDVTVHQGAQSTSGVPLARPFSSFFTTEPPPRVLEQFTIPADREVRVPITTPITVVFSQAMDETSIPPAFSLVFGSSLVTGNDGTFTFTTESSPPRTRAVFQPASPLPVTTSVQIRVNGLARSVRGVNLDPLFFSNFVTQ
jgi:hypothetical protein